MPAERSRGSRRTGADGTQLVWTMPVEPTSASGISFATNLTPITFSEAGPDGVSSASLPEPNLFPFVDESASPRRPGHSKKKPENHIPRPPNAFILFRSSFIKSQHVSTEVETNHSTLSKIIGLTWQNLPEDERQIWHHKAKVALDDHKRRFPNYAFRPLHSKGKNEKRKVREVGPKDLKRCAKIAELLVEGKKGTALDTAIQEFDKHHVPEVVTRFEAPITERTFKRSSSRSPFIAESDDEEDIFVTSSISPSSVPSRQSSRSCSPDKSDFRREDSLPPLVDPPADYTEFLPSPTIHPSTEESPYTFNSGSESHSSFNYTTFPFDYSTQGAPPGFEPVQPQSQSPAPSSENADDTDTTPTRRPSLTINTSFNTQFPISPTSTSACPDAYTAAPAPASVPQTPAYPEFSGYAYSGYNDYNNATNASTSEYPSTPIIPFNPYLSSMSSSVESLASTSSLPSLSHSLPSSGSSSYEDLSTVYRIPMTPVTPPPATPLDPTMHTHGNGTFSPVPWEPFDYSSPCKIESYSQDNTSVPSLDEFVQQYFPHLDPSEFDIDAVLRKTIINGFNMQGFSIPVSEEDQTNFSSAVGMEGSVQVY